jgi:hypothetical protein
MNNGQVVTLNQLFDIHRNITIQKRLGIWKNISFYRNFANLKTLNPDKNGPQISFSRGSGGTQVNSSGLIELIPSNLQTYSEDFDTANWSKSGTSTCVKNQVGFNGLPNNACLFTCQAGVGSYLSNAVSVTNNTITTRWAIVKAGTTSKIIFEFSNNGTITQTTFDITTGSITGDTNASITDLGNGWKRVSRTVTSGATGSQSWIAIYFDTYGSASGATTMTIDRVQVESGSVANQYVKTTNVAASAPRFTHNPLTNSSLGLLIEGSRTNLIYPSIPDGTNLNLQNVTLSTNQGISPDGTNNATRMTSVLGSQARAETSQFSNSVAYVVSAFVKYESARYVGFGHYVTSTQQISFDILNGTIGSITGTEFSSPVITSYGNGWYRISALFTSAGSGSGLKFHVSNVSDLSINTGVSISALYWGMQLEAGSFITSYIPTINATTTRAADVIQVTGNNFSSWYNQTQGTILLEASQLQILPSSAFLFPFQISNSAATESFGAFITSTSSQNIIYAIGNTVAGGQYMQFSTNKLFGINPYKFAISYSKDYVSISNDGSSTSSDLSVAIPSVDRLTLGAVGNLSSNNFFNGTIASFIYYGKQLSDYNLRLSTTYADEYYDIDVMKYLSNTSYNFNGQTAIANYIIGLKADGIWDKIVDHGLFAGQSNFNNIFVKLKGNGTLSNNNFTSSDYNSTGASIGLKGDGSSKYLDNLTPISSFGSTANLSYGVYLIESLTSNSNDCLIGANSIDLNSNSIAIRYKSTDVRFGFAYGRNSSTYSSTLPADPTGFSIGVCSASNSAAVYYWSQYDTNPTINSRGTNRIVYTPTYVPCLFASKSIAGGIDTGTYSSARIAAYIQGTKLTQSEAQSLRDRLQTLLVALGYTF